MAVTFHFKFKNIELEFVPEDTDIVLESYLADAEGLPFIDENNRIDTFNVRTQNSSIPSTTSTGIKSYLEILSGDSINEKYTQIQSATVSLSSNILTNIASTEGLKPGMIITGEPISATGPSGIPPGTTLDNVRTPNSVQISNSATGIGNATQEENVTFSSQGWNINYDALDFLVTAVNFSAL